MRVWAASLIVVLCAAAAHAEGIPPLPTAAPDYVIVISEDGLRPDAIDAEHTPNHVRFLKEGASARLARTIHESDTLPVRTPRCCPASRPSSTACSGTASDTDAATFTSRPTSFPIAREHGLSTAMLIRKPKLRHIALPGSVDHLERPGYMCRKVSLRAAEYFAAERPRLMFVHFSDPDEYGHKQGWMSGADLKGVASSDRCLGTLLDGIEASGLADRTLVIVTADHGGHGKVHSGSQHEVDCEIPWMARGPGVTRGLSIQRTISTVDTAATVLTALGLPLPDRMAGAPIRD